MLPATIGNDDKGHFYELLQKALLKDYTCTGVATAHCKKRIPAIFFKSPIFHVILNKP